MTFHPQHRIIELLTRAGRPYIKRRYLFVDHAQGWQGQWWTHNKAAAAPFTPERAQKMKWLLKTQKNLESHVIPVRTRSNHFAGAGNMVKKGTQ